MARMESFEEFWPYYVGEHKLPLNRALHYFGTTMAITTVGAAVVTLNPLWLLATPVVGYGPAWFGHYVLEGNRPATLTYPLWSIRGDLRMLKYALKGKMAAEVERVCGLQPEPESTSTANGAAHESVHVNA
jgi:hypothetical protein